MAATPPPPPVPPTHRSPEAGTDAGSGASSGEFAEVAEVTGSAPAGAGCEVGNDLVAEERVSIADGDSDEDEGDMGDGLDDDDFDETGPEVALEGDSSGSESSESGG